MVYADGQRLIEKVSPVCEFNSVAGVKSSHVPYRGAGPAINDLIGGHIQFLNADLPVLLVEHDIDRVFQLADHVTVMNEGKVLLDGTVEDARRSAKVQEVYIGSGASQVAARPRQTAGEHNAART